MSHFKPASGKAQLPAMVIDGSAIKLSVARALSENNVDTFLQCKLARIQENWFYQVKEGVSDSLTYIHAGTGKVLENGDRIYAADLAGSLVTGSRASSEHMHNRIPEAELMLVSSSSDENEFSAGDQRPKIKSLELVSHFTREYKASNKILPVYKVSFQRSDGLRLFIDTKSGKMLHALDNRRHAFNQFFSFAHSWSFLSGYGKAKQVLIGSISLLCFISSITGFYIYHISSSKKKIKKSGTKIHRVAGNIFLLTTLLYALSGAWHAFAKINHTSPPEVTGKLIRTKDLVHNRAESEIWKNKKITRFSLVQLNGQILAQADVLNETANSRRYFNMQTGAEKKSGDFSYAASIASLHSKRNDVISTTAVHRHTNEYGMMNKMLPVVRVAYNNGPVYFIETGSGKVAAISDGSKAAERFSFSNLHMHHYWEKIPGRAGRTVKEVFLAGTTLGLMLVAFSGMMIYFNRKKKQSPPGNKS